MESELNKKKIYIYKNIEKLLYHNDIIDYIKNNNIKYTENSNGFFLNISLIDDHINDIYNILQYNLKNNIENDKLIIKKQEINLINDRKSSNKHKGKYNIKINDFNSNERKLILESKKYNIN